MREATRIHLGAVKKLLQLESGTSLQRVTRGYGQCQKCQHLQESRQWANQSFFPNPHPKLKVTQETSSFETFTDLKLFAAMATTDNPVQCDCLLISLNKLQMAMSHRLIFDTVFVARLSKDHLFRIGKMDICNQSRQMPPLSRVCSLQLLSQAKSAKQQFQRNPTQSICTKFLNCLKQAACNICSKEISAEGCHANN